MLFRSGGGVGHPTSGFVGQPGDRCAFCGPLNSRFSEGGCDIATALVPLGFGRGAVGNWTDLERRFAQAGQMTSWPHDARRGVFNLATAGSLLFAATGDGRLRQYELPEGKLVRESPDPHAWLFGLAVHLATERVVTTTRGGIARV